MKKIDRCLNKGWNRFDAFMEKAQWWFLGFVVLYLTAQIVRALI